MKPVRTSLRIFFYSLLFMTNGCVSTLKVATYKSSIEEYDMRYMATKSELELMSSTLPFLRWFGFTPPKLAASGFGGRSYNEPIGFSPILTSLCLVDLPFSLITDTFMYYLDDYYFNMYKKPHKLKNLDPKSRNLEPKEIADRQIKENSP